MLEEKTSFPFWDAQPCSRDLEGRQKFPSGNVDCGFDQCVPWAESLGDVLGIRGFVLVLGYWSVCVCIDEAVACDRHMYMWAGAHMGSMLGNQTSWEEHRPGKTMLRGLHTG